MITAGHVSDWPTRLARPSGLGDTEGDDLIPIAGNWISSVPREGSEIDPCDVAVYLLPSDIVAKLQKKHFLRIGDGGFHDPGPRAVFSLFGYPGVWAASSRSNDERVTVKPLEFTTHAYDGNVQSLIGYQSHLHLLLAGGPAYITALDGSNIEVRDRHGQPTRLPRALKGISGCSVWHVGDLAVPIEQWGDRPASVVGVETWIYQASGVITASRWAVVTTVIHKAFPDLRRPIELWQR